jgi:hypothetical protein
MFSKIFFFFSHKKLKKPPSKVAHNRPKSFISQSSPAHSPELIFHIIKCREQAPVLLSVIPRHHFCFQEISLWLSKIL